MTLTTTQLLQFGSRIGRADRAIQRANAAREALLNDLNRATNGGTSPDGIAEDEKMRPLAEDYCGAAQDAADMLEMILDEAAKYGLTTEALDAIYSQPKEKSPDYWKNKSDAAKQMIDTIKEAQAEASEEMEGTLGALFGAPLLEEIKERRDAARAKIMHEAAVWNHILWEAQP